MSICAVESRPQRVTLVCRMTSGSDSGMNKRSPDIGRKLIRTRSAIYLLLLITKDDETPSPYEIREAIRLLLVQIRLPTPAKYSTYDISYR